MAEEDSMNINLPTIKCDALLQLVSKHMHATNVSPFSLERESEKLMLMEHDAMYDGFIYITYLCPFGAWKVSTKECNAWYKGLYDVELDSPQELIKALRGAIEGYHSAD